MVVIHMFQDTIKMISITKQIAFVAFYPIIWIKSQSNICIQNKIHLQAGFGGLASANLLRKSLTQQECQITVVDKNQHFMMGLVNLWVLSGSRRLENSQVASDKLEAKGIKFLNYEITSIDHSTSTVTTKSNHDKFCLRLENMNSQKLPLMA